MYITDNKSHCRYLVQDFIHSFEMKTVYHVHHVMHLDFHQLILTLGRCNQEHINKNA